MDHKDTSDGGIEPASVITADPEAAPRRGAANIVPSFLAELTRAMQAAAGQQREQIAAIIADDAAGEVEKANARGAIEADELRRLADEDVQAIETWLAEETDRIRAEAGRRTDERRSELESHLDKHHSIIASEVEGVENAVRGYQATLDAFFAELGEATNPATLARRAGSLPTPPDLETVRGAARADAVAKFARADATPDTAPEPTEGEADDGADASFEPSPVPDPEPEIATEAEPLEPAAAVAVEDEPSDDGVGLGVMDPAAVGRSEDVVAPLEPALSGSVPPSSAAIRLFRTLTDWAQPNGSEDHRDAPQP
jgi:hypothetical protein